MLSLVTLDVALYTSGQEGAASFRCTAECVDSPEAEMRMVSGAHV